VIASKIAAHAADIAKGRRGSIDKDLQMSVARKKLDWEKQASYALDKSVFECIEKGKPCTMCSNYCSIKIMSEFM
jgi:phosphomethylpyrimidine synthase